MKLQAVDTNVLLRYLTADDPRQSLIAKRFIDQPGGPSDELLVTVPVVCELTWLLRSKRYGLDREQIADTWERLLDSSRFRFQARDQVAQAIGQYRSGTADLSDYLILLFAQDEGAAEVVTFDEAFASVRGVSDLGGRR